MKRNRLVLPVVLLAAVGCTSPDRINDVLQPVVENPNPSPSASPAPTSPALGNLEEALKKNGAEPVGMEFEDTAVLEMLYRVFSDPRLANRRIKLVYTGLQLSYDRKAESLTVGGTKKESDIIAFILKEVPKK